MFLITEYQKIIKKMIIALRKQTINLTGFVFGGQSGNKGNIWSGINLLNNNLNERG